MARFDEMDARAAAAVGRMNEDIIVWRPMVKTGGGYTSPGLGPDPARPPRELPAIITWAITGMPVESSTGGGVVGTATLFIDFEDVFFQEDPYAQFGRPKKDDLIEMPTEKDPNNRMARISRIGDDGSSRFYAWANLVSEMAS